MIPEHMKILAIGAHPDDLEFGCGDTLIKYAQKGHEVFLLLVTKGGQGGTENTRYKEQLESAKVIGVKEVLWGEFKDTELLNKGNEIIQMVEGHINQLKPDLIFVNYYDDTHQDHRTVNEAVQSATRYVRNVLFYEVPTTTNFTPQVFVNISETLGLSSGPWARTGPRS